MNIVEFVRIYNIAILLFIIFALGPVIWYLLNKYFEIQEKTSNRR